jgi:hypothetical protein
MKKFVFCVVLCGAALGCRAGPDRVAVSAAFDAWKVIQPEYTSYVTNDPALDPDSKAIRAKTAELLTKTFEAMTKEAQ